MTTSELPIDIDLCDGHGLIFCYAYGLPHTDENRIGGIIRHTKPDGKLCEGSIWFDVPYVREHFADKPRWTISGPWEKMTCTPSFLCHCGDHGFIRDGFWVRA